MRRGAVVRSEHLHRLTASGWDALMAHGVRTLVDLRNRAERERNRQAPPDGLATVEVGLEEGLDQELAGWMSSGLMSTPLYYKPFLRRWPERCASAVAAVARAGPGGVLVHCGKGCDRTGLVTLLLLAICEVSPDDIADDYELTVPRLQTHRAASLGAVDDMEPILAVLAREGCRALRGAILDLPAEVDVLACLREGGLMESDVVAIRQRLLGPDCGEPQDLVTS